MFSYGFGFYLLTNEMFRRQYPINIPWKSHSPLIFRKILNILSLLWLYTCIQQMFHFKNRPVYSASLESGFTERKDWAIGVAILGTVSMFLFMLIFFCLKVGSFLYFVLDKRPPTPVFYLFSSTCTNDISEH